MPLMQLLFSLVSQYSALEDIASVLLQMTGMAKSFELKEDAEEDDPRYHIYCVTRARVSYLLLRVQRLDRRAIPESSPPTVATGGAALRESIRLGLLIFLLSLSGFTPGPGSAIASHGARLAKVIQLHDWSRDMGLSKLHLWVLAIAVVTVEASVARGNFLSRMGTILTDSGCSWANISSELRQMVWVKGALDSRLHVQTAHLDG